MHGQGVVAAVIGMSRQWIIAAVVVALLNSAGNAGAARADPEEKLDEKAARHDARDERHDAKDDAHKERGSPKPEEPPAVDAPPAATAPAADVPAPISVVGLSSPPAADGAVAPAPARAAPTQDEGSAATQGARAARSLPTSAPPAEGSALAGGGAFAPHAPGRTTAPSSGDDPDDGATWARILWAIPLVGIGGLGAVLLLRRRSHEREMARRVPVAAADPRDLTGILQSGQRAIARGAMAEGIAWFERALRLAPTLAVAHFCKGVCLAASGRTAEAFGALQSAVREAPDEASYRIHFARVALALGKTKDAMDALEHVSRAIPELGAEMLEDPQLAGLRDHPRFLAMSGAL